MLEGSDRAVGVGEGGLEMVEDLRDRLARWIRRQRRRQLRRGAVSQECCADLALSVNEPLPDALPGPLVQRAVKAATGSEDAAGDDALEELPQSAGGQAEPPDFVGAPDAESPSATWPRMAVAAKDPPRALRLFLGAALVKSIQIAMKNQRADNLAVPDQILIAFVAKLRLYGFRHPKCLFAELSSILEKVGATWLARDPQPSPKFPAIRQTGLRST